MITDKERLEWMIEYKGQVEVWSDKFGIYAHKLDEISPTFDTAREAIDWGINWMKEHEKPLA